MIFDLAPRVLISESHISVHAEKCFVESACTRFVSTKILLNMINADFALKQTLIFSIPQNILLF